jgi:hypothetical protein
MRYAILATSAAALMMASACGAYSFPGSSGRTGTVSGTVNVFPCAPVEQQGQPCKNIPGAGLQIIFSGDPGSRTATVDSNGHYSIDLEAGTWKVSVKPIARIISGPTTLGVPAGGSVHADYVVDSGIRLPGPAAAAS